MGERDDPLLLDPETMRDIGYRAVDAVVDLLRDPSVPPVRRATAGEMAERVSSDAPEWPSPFDELLGRLSADVLPYGSSQGHPGFFAFVPGGGTFPGALGDFLASALNVFTEHGAFFDDLEEPAEREHGTGLLLDGLAAFLGEQVAA